MLNVVGNTKSSSNNRFFNLASSLSHHKVQHSHAIYRICYSIDVDTKKLLCNGVLQNLVLLLSCMCHISPTKLEFVCMLHALLSSCLPTHP
jgi:hypothetical protein